MVNRRAIAVIPARGGSKRLLRKNEMPFAGKPMLVHSIEAAQATGFFDRILVSTDDPGIAAAACAAGAEAPFLREDHADDHAPVSAATILAVQTAMLHYGERYEVVVQLMANCPLRGAESIKAGFARLARQDVQFLISAFRYGWMNPWWAATLGPDGRPTALFPQVGDTRSQDLPPLFCPSGAVWVATWEALEAAGTFFGPGHVYFDIGWHEAVDIDDTEDLAFAQAVWEMRARVQARR
ncbi:MAG: acylneuraminate cytidylyltransferase family protein [Magnetospirillum sp.]|nr:acylneuraminate cytidylyltransferase family protein [Magnetospirillum sp.]